MENPYEWIIWTKVPNIASRRRGTITKSRILGYAPTREKAIERLRKITDIDPENLWATTLENYIDKNLGDKL